MPGIDDRAIVLRQQPSRGGSSCRVVRSVAIISAIPLWLGACSPIGQSTSQAAVASPPTTVKPLPGPIVLAPSMTGPLALAPPPAPPPTPAPALAMPAPPPGAALAVAIPALPPGPTTAVEIPTFASVPCPPGAIAMWGEPDMSGTPVPICRRLGPPR
jgi:hypothetical protein